MADISKITVDGTTYDLKDASSRDLGDKMVKYSEQSLTSEQKTQVLTNWGLKNLAKLIYEMYTTLVVRYPSSQYNVTVTITKSGATTQTYTGNDGCHEFILPNVSASVGTSNWTAKIEGDGHKTITGTVQVPSLGSTGSITLAWTNTDITVNHPAGNSTYPTTIRIVNGDTAHSSTSNDGAKVQSVFGGATSTNQVTLAGEWTVTVTSSGTVHNSVSGTVYVSEDFTSRPTITLTWTDVKCIVAHPTTATTKLINSSSKEYTGTYSSGKTTYYLPTGSYRFTASHTKHTSLYYPSSSTWQSVSQTSINPYNLDAGAWTDTIVKVSIPSTGTATKWSGTGTYNGSYVNSGSYKVYTYKLTQNGGAYAFYPKSDYHTSYATTNSSGSYPIALFGAVVNSDGTISSNGSGINLQNTYSDIVLDFKDTYLDVTHPSGATITCKSSSRTISSSYIMTLETTKTRIRLIYTDTSGYVVTAALTGHTSYVSSAVPVSSLNNNLTAINFTTTWKDTTISVGTIPSGSTVTCTTKPSGATATVSGKNVLVNKTGSYTIGATLANYKITSVSQNVSSLNDTYSIASLSIISTAVTLNYPSGATITLTRPSGAPNPSYTENSTTQRGYTIQYLGTYSYKLALTGHSAMTVSASVTSSNAGTAQTVGKTSWNDTTITATVPSYSTVTCVNRSNSATYSVTKSSSAATTCSALVNAANVTYRFTCTNDTKYSSTYVLHNSVYVDKTITTLNDTYTASVAWSDILLVVTRFPSGASIAAIQSGTTISLNAYSGDSTKKYCYLTADGDWYIQATHSSHSGIQSTLSSVTRTGNAAKTIALAANWSDIVLRVSHPSDAEVGFGSSDDTSGWTNIYSTTTYKMYKLIKANVTYTLSVASSAKYSSSTIPLHYVVKTFTPSSLQVDYSTVNVTYDNILLVVSRPSGSTITCKNSSGVAQSVYTISSTYYYYHLPAGTYNLTCYLAGHTMQEGSVTITASQVSGNTAVQYTFNSDWTQTDSYIRCRWLKGADVYVTDGVHAEYKAYSDGELYSDLVYWQGSVIAPSRTTCTVRATSGETTVSTSVKVTAFKTYYYGDGTSSTTLDTSKTKYDLSWDVPTKYQKVQYIQSNGGGYLDTGIIMSSGITVTVRYSFIGSSGAIGGTYCSNYTSNAQYCCFWLAFPGYNLNPYATSSSPEIFIGSYSSSGSASASGSVTVPFTTPYGYLAAYATGNSPTMYLFALHDCTCYQDDAYYGNAIVSGGATFRSSSRIYSFSTTGETHNYVPIYQKTSYADQSNSGTVGFYDTAKSTVNFNGSGLTAGPAVTS